MLRDRIRCNLSEVIVYRRDHDQVELRAGLGMQLLRLQESDGTVRIQYTDMDFLIPNTDAFSFDGGMGRITPEFNDMIHLIQGECVETFEVLPYGAGEPPWRWSNQFRTLFRVHAKHVGSEAYF